MSTTSESWADGRRVDHGQTDANETRADGATGRRTRVGHGQTDDEWGHGLMDASGTGFA